AAGNVAAEFTGDAHQLLDLLHGAHLGRARLVPEVVLDAAAYVQAHGDAHHVDRKHIAHAAFHGQHRAVGDGAQEVGQAVDRGLVHAAADRNPVHDQRALVHTATDQALDGLVAVDVVELERALDAGGAQAAHVLLDPAG